MVNPLINNQLSTGIGSSLGMANTQGHFSGGVISNSAAQQHAYNHAMAAQLSPFSRTASRLHVQVDVVTNGYLLTVDDTRMIAKDLEELQQHFIAQVASMMLDKDK